MKISAQIKGSFSGAPLFARRSICPSIACETAPRTTHGHVHHLSEKQRLLAYQKGTGAPEKPPQRNTQISCIPPPVLVKALHHSPGAHNEPSSLRSTWTTRKRAFSSAGKEQEIEEGEPGLLDREDLLSMVDGYPNTSVNEQFRLVNDRYLSGFAAAAGPELTVSERADDKSFPSFEEIQSNDPGVLRTLSDLWRAIRHSLKRPWDTDIEYIWNLYQSLPQPRMLHLPSTLRHRFMKVIGQEKRNHRSMLRYFSAVADIQNSGLRLIPAEWNQALNLAGRYVGHTTRTELAEVIKLWNKMEAASDVKANAVTFNVLFDVASKAGNFVFAEMLYNEMEKRGYKFNRYHYVSLIHLFGLKMDSDGIRVTYREMIEAGELIDTTVLNCVIVGFLRCGEEYAAERVYERMKSSHVTAPKMPYRNYMSDKIVTKVLHMFSKVSRQADNSDLHDHFQQLSPVVPDIKTYSLMLTHFALRAPSMEKVAQYLDDMKWFNIPMHGSIFLTLFKGFAKHGGRGSTWSSNRLEKVYAALLSARQDNVHGIYISVFMAKWILKAFNKCDGEDRMWEVWAELQPYSEMDFEADGAEYFDVFLADLISRPRSSWQFRDTNLFGTFV